MDEMDGNIQYNTILVSATDTVRESAVQQYCISALCGATCFTACTVLYGKLFYPPRPPPSTSTYDIAS